MLCYGQVVNKDNNLSTVDQTRELPLTMFNLNKEIRVEIRR